jgi:hypothetical protein
MPAGAIDPVFFAVYAAAVDERLTRSQTLIDLARDRHRLIRYLREVSALEAAVVKTAKLRAKPSDVYYGYVEIPSNGCTVFVPFHVTYAFPVASCLAGLVGTAKAIRVSKQGEICLSGSSVYMGRLRAVGDIDYCEYFPLTDPTMLANVRRLARDPRKATVCARLRWGARNDQWPWPGLDSLLKDADQAFRNTHPSSGDLWKLDFVGSAGRIGPLAITNLALAVDIPLAEEGGGQRSWVYQEAVIGFRKGVPIRSMVRPEEIGNYLNWLRQQISDHVDEKPQKAAKRALSLASLMLLTEERDELLELLQAPELSKYVAHSALDEATKLLPSSKTANVKKLRSKLDAKTKELGGPPSDPPGVELAKCKVAAIRVAARFDQLISDALYL